MRLPALSSWFAEAGLRCRDTDASELWKTYNSELPNEKDTAIWRFCNDPLCPLCRRARCTHVCGSDVWRQSASSQRLAKLADSDLSGRGRLRRCRCGGDG